MKRDLEAVYMARLSIDDDLPVEVASGLDVGDERTVVEDEELSKHTFRVCDPAVSVAF